MPPMPPRSPRLAASGADAARVFGVAAPHGAVATRIATAAASRSAPRHRLVGVARPPATGKIVSACLAICSCICMKTCRDCSR